LDFRLAHARAMDAVQQPFDAAAFAGMLDHRGVGVMCLFTLAADRTTYLHRPDLGSVLQDKSRHQLEQWAHRTGRCDLVIIVSDGLSPLAAERQAPVVLEHLLPLLLGSTVVIPGRLPDTVTH